LRNRSGENPAAQHIHALRISAPFTRESDEKVATARQAVRTGKAIREDAAFQVASEVALNIGWYRMAIPIAFARQHQVGLQVLLDDAVQDGLFGTATGVRGRSTSP